MGEAEHKVVVRRLIDTIPALEDPAVYVCQSVFPPCTNAQPVIFSTFSQAMFEQTRFEALERRGDDDGMMAENGPIARMCG